MNNHCIINSAEDLLTIDDLITQKGPDLCILDTSRTNKDKKASKKAKKITIVKDEVQYHFKVYIVTVFNLKQITCLPNNNSSRQGATANLTKNDSINLV